MLPLHLESDSIRIGNLRIAFHRTLRIPDDGTDYPLPPSMGRFPLCRVEDHASRVPAEWRAHGGVFLPMYQREAMWLSFECPAWRPQALKVAAGMVNAVSGDPWDQEIRADREQDYLVAPPQPWLDGINSGSETIRQFVAMPLGMGYTVEGQITGEERFGGIQVVAFEPKAGRFPQAAPKPWRVAHGPTGSGPVMSPAPAPAGAPSVAKASMEADRAGSPVLHDAGAEMGLAAGGRMHQAVYPDPHGPDTWDTARFGRVYVHIVNSAMYAAITGRPAPPTPVDARAYAKRGLPWFDLYDERLGDLPASEALSGVKGVAAKDAEHGFTGQQDDEPVEIDPGAVTTYPAPAAAPAPDRIADGTW